MSGKQQRSNEIGRGERVLQRCFARWAPDPSHAVHLVLPPTFEMSEIPRSVVKDRAPAYTGRNLGDHRFHEPHEYKSLEDRPVKRRAPLCRLHRGHRDFTAILYHPDPYSLWGAGNPRHFQNRQPRAPSQTRPARQGRGMPALPGHRSCGRLCCAIGTPRLSVFWLGQGGAFRFCRAVSVG